jgi:dihydrofolate reductase
MGRKTYAFAASQQPKPRSKKPPKKAASKSAVPAIKTYVFSRTLAPDDAPDVELVRTDAEAFVRNLKAQPGKDIMLMGGGELAQSLMAAGLVDRVGLNIHPVLLGAGVPAFRDPGQRVLLQLTECRQLAGGCILANYDVRRIGG